jgi:membrane bound O-acyltransferase family protein
MTEPFVRMLMIIAATFLSVKIAVLAIARRHGTQLDARGMFLFLGWPGMRPALFARRAERSGGAALVAKGIRALAGGAALFVVARSVALSPLPAKHVVVTILALPALSLMLHFGLFEIVTGVYRLRGFGVGELFRAPLRSHSLTEFWSRRWNIGFSEMIAVLVHGPLRRASPRAALFASFLVSGLLHELAISVPVRAGYGLPAAYFVLQGVLVALEKRMRHEPGRLWTLFWLIAPLLMLFHPPFLRGIVWPLVGLK